MTQRNTSQRLRESWGSARRISVRPRGVLRVGLYLCVLSATPSSSLGVGQWSEDPSWLPPAAERVRTELLATIERLGPTVQQREELIALREQLEQEVPPQNLLELVADTAAVVDKRASTLVEASEGSLQLGGLPETAWLLDADLPPLLTNNLRLLTAHWLMQEGLLDEALDLIANLSPEDVVDPAALLFCKAVCQHQLVEVESAAESAKQLLERAGELPTRYEHLARLISEDLKAVEEDSLDHIARQMNHVRRRLDNGHADNRVIDIEDSVVESLDKLIEELEQQRRQQQQQQQGGGGQSPTQPMEQSMLPRGMQGPGSVDRSDVGNRSGWGAIDDKEREQALQDIGREFPSHYRDVIEQYFKKIAAEAQAEP